jgi:ATP-dependent Lon protease
LKEKVLAGASGWIKKILIPAENEKDIEEIPASVLKSVELELVSHVDDVLKKALVLDDPETLFSHMPVELQPKDESSPFADKVDDVPASEILPQ